MCILTDSGFISVEYLLWVVMRSGLIVAKPSLVREGLQAMLQAIPDVEILEPVEDGVSALGTLKSRHVDLVILDSSLSEDELVTTVTKIKGRYPETRCLVVTDKPCRNKELKAAGTDDVLIKGFSAEILSKRTKDLLDSSGTQRD
jgi:DNA-binding NarL/FixJ family response regulator